MAPSLGGQSSGLQVACQIANADIFPQISIKDYDDAVWHYGGARAVYLSARRTGTTVNNNVPGTSIVKVCPDNLQATAGAACNGGVGTPAGHLTIKAADINHSVEYPTSTTHLQGLYIAPGTFVKCIGGTAGCTATAGFVQLSKPVLNNRIYNTSAVASPPNVGPTGTCKGIAGPPPGGTPEGCLVPVQPQWGACATFANPCYTPPVRVLVSNDTGRAVTDATTTAGSACIGSATANFNAADIGMGISGGDIPDSAVIDSIANVPPKVPVCAANQAHILCTGCSPTVPITTASAQVITLTPTKAPSSSRYVASGSTCSARTITGGGPAFAPSDVGLPVTFVPAVAGLAGARIGSVGAGGATAVLAAGQTGATLNSCGTGAAKRFVLGLATKTAPATGDSVATLAISLQVDPTVSPTSPPCGANKVSGFQIPLSWRNPEGTGVAAADPFDANVLGAAGYNVFVGGTHLSGVSPAPHSVAQLDFRTASTSFAGYVQQTYTSPGTPAVQGPSSYVLRYTFLPVGVGVCGGTDLSTQWSIFGLSKKIVENPSFTAGGGGGVRGLKDEVQGSGGTTYTGAAGAQVRVNVNDVTTLPMVNSCLVNSPIPPEPGCNW